MIVVSATDNAQTDLRYMRVYTVITTSHFRHAYLKGLAVGLTRDVACSQRQSRALKDSISFFVSLDLPPLLLRFAPASTPSRAPCSWSTSFAFVGHHGQQFRPPSVNGKLVRSDRRDVL